MNDHTNYSPEKEGSPLGMTRTTSDEETSGQKADLAAPASKITNKCLLLMMSICSGGFLFGYDIGVISGCLIMRDFIQRFGDLQGNGTYVLSAHTQSLIVSLLGAGTFFGALAQAPLSDRIGRQKSMIIWAVIFVVGAIIQTATETSVAQLCVGRFIAGLSVGALSGLCPLYLGETAPKAIRGTMVACYQLFIITGISLSYGIAWATQNAQDSSACWRIPVALQMLWGLILTGLVLFLPESPRWELQNSNIDRARETMAAMRGVKLVNGPNGLRGDYAIEEELDEMEEYIRMEREHFAGTNYFTAYLKCFSRDKQLWRRTLQGMFLQIFQQLNGQNFYYYYGPTFFQAANVALSAYQIQFILGIVSFACTWPALYLIDKMGRRNLLLAATGTCTICAFIVGFVGHFGLAPSGTVPTSAQQMAGNAFIAFAVLHLAAYSSGNGPVPWVYLSESFPQHVRAKCISIGSASNWFWNFMLGYFSAGISEQYGPLIMVIFAAINCVCFAFVLFILPETKGLTLEQVDEMYVSGAANKAWKTGKWVPSHGNSNRNTLGKGIA